MQENSSHPQLMSEEQDNSSQQHPHHHQQQQFADHFHRMIQQNHESEYIVQQFNMHPPQLQVQHHRQPSESVHHQSRAHQFSLDAQDGFSQSNHTFTSIPYSLSASGYVTSSGTFTKQESNTQESFRPTNTFTTASDFTVNTFVQSVRPPTNEDMQVTIDRENPKEETSNSPDDEMDGDSTEDEDVHQCGRCKQVYHSLKEYISHKESKVCKTKLMKAVVDSPPSVTENNPQNILETAAKNTIFRDQFIMTASNVDLQPNVEEDSVEKSMSGKEKDDEDEDADSVEAGNEDDNETKNMAVLKFMKEDGADGMENKKRRGRPPKTFNPDDESLRKTKRKSRPPRRHKPDEDAQETAAQQHQQQQMQGNDLPRDAAGNVILSALDASGLPTVENIQRYFSSGRGRGRGRGGRGRTPLHRCPICQLLFPNRPTMMEHKRKHSKIFKCKICNEGFYTEEKLEKHSTRETHSYGCDECERVLTSKQALIRHKLSHSDKIYKCDECGRGFKTERDLKNHQLGMHSETRDYVCEVCNKGFSRREKLKRHLMIHAPDRPIYTCPFKNHVGCDKTFYRKDKLTRHLYSHSKVKPFKCDQCDKSFARTDNLREHIRSHTGIFRYYCTVCGKGQPGPKKFLQHLLKQHNVENAEIPKPFDELAPEPLIQQHKQVVQAENAARLARAASNMKKERDKSAQKARKDDLDCHDMQVDQAQHHVALATMNGLSLQSALISSPTQQSVSTEQQGLTRSGIETLYSINQHTATSPQFQIGRHIPETMVRHISESLLRERENQLRESLPQQTIARQIVETNDGIARHQLVESSHLSASETIRRQISETAVSQPREVQDQQQQQQQQQQVQQQTLATGLSVEAEGSIPVSRGLHLLSQGVLPGSLQFTTLLNSDLVAIGEAVIRNQNGIPTMFQQKFGPAQ